MKARTVSQTRVPAQSAVSWRTILAVAVALICAISVYGFNGRATFYYDTEGYLEAGKQVLSLFGADLVATSVETGAEIAPASESSTTATVASTHDAPADNTTVGSRSAVYAAVLALFAWLGNVDFAVAANLAIFWLAVWIVAKVAVRGIGLEGRPAEVAASLTVAGALGSLPFYVAFLMPDLLAPVLILMLALLTAFLRQLRASEIVLSIAVAIAAILAHPSHLMIAVVMIPLCVLMAPAAVGHRWKIAALCALLVGGGLAERFIFSSAVNAIRHSQVIYLPFLTARLVEDGPGRDYLAAHCPDPALATCALYEQLERPGDRSYRFDAPVILFSSDPNDGSYALLSPDIRAKVAAEQLEFGLRTFLSAPLAVTGALVANTIDQLHLVSVDMTIPTPDMVGSIFSRPTYLTPDHADGRLLGPSRGWISWVSSLHAAVYLGSLLGLLIVLRRSETPESLRLFIVTVLLGLIANAFICGAISEPASRYGARVGFLLPLTLALAVWPRSTRRVSL
ncbi:hypothetical protein L0V05_01625 [Tabrizicola sp. J26]|uniref:hypothetical protein n=1 Tax=Alitabrizicola rongguiensis TaxID=2909234 RepID=UPI001F33C848|nr:hypothetical protein [Tabrizicola rongguiensis]MCF1707507.1 hypothetical protein [Tabrizicola rongguiensis]